jgi:hypothetical protein
MEVENGLPFKFYYENIDSFGKPMPNNLSAKEIEDFSKKNTEYYDWIQYEIQGFANKLLGNAYHGWVKKNNAITTNIDDKNLIYLCEAFTPSYYYDNNFIDNISPKAFEKIKKGEMIVVFNWFAEPLYDTSFNVYMERICRKYELDISNFFVLTSANNIPTDSKIKYISDHFFIKNAANTLKMFLKQKVVEGHEFNFQNELVDYDIFNIKKEKHFLSLNRTVNRAHRYAFGLFLEEYNLWDKGYFTFLNLKEPETQANVCISQSKFNSYGEIHTNFLSKLPIEIDTHFLKNKNQMNSFPTGNTYYKKYYQDTAINIVTETTFENNTVFISEKTFHPILNFQPFIILSSNGQLAELKKLGFKTFHNIIDESYDDEEDSRKRFKMVCDEILRLANLPMEEINRLVLSCKNICIYNRNHLLSFIDYDVFENSSIKIKEICNSQEKKLS